MKKPRDLLGRVTELMNRDLDHIEMYVREGKLDRYAAADLARYTTVILGITKDEDNETEKQRKSVAKMTTEELRAVLEKELARNDKKEVPHG